MHLFVMANLGSLTKCHFTDTHPYLKNLLKKFQHTCTCIATVAFENENYKSWCPELQLFNNFTGDVKIPVSHTVCVLNVAESTEQQF